MKTRSAWESKPIRVCGCLASQTEKYVFSFSITFSSSRLSSSPLAAKMATAYTGIGIANLPNQVGSTETGSGKPFHRLLRILAAQNCCKNRCPLHHHGCWYVHCNTWHTLCTENRELGESGLGKTTLINTLFSTELSPNKDYRRRHVKQLDKLTEVEIIKAELEEKSFKVKLTVIDTPGFGDYVNNRDSWAPIIDFVDDQHEIYMRQEQQPERGEKSDLRVHACLYFIRPTGHT